MDEHHEQREREEGDSEEIRPSIDALDPSGAYANTPGRTGRPPGEGPEHPGDETVPPPD
jgi:hypothetical protein